MIDISASLLENIVYEVRYKGGYLYWDNCGKIWNKLVSKFPEIEMETVSPQEAKLKIHKEDVTLSFTVGHLNISQQYPKNLNLFAEISDEAFNIITSMLEIKSLSRIGNRFFHTFKASNSEEALEFIKKINCFIDMSKKISSFGDTIKDPQIKFTVTKGEEKGYIINISYLERKLNLSLPKIIRYDASSFLQNVVQMDIDFFTLKPVDCSIVKSSEIIKKNERDVKYIIEKLIE